MIDFQHIAEATLAALEYIPVTLLLTFASLILGTVFGLVIALIRFYKVAFLSPLFRFIITILRGIPVVLILLATYLFSSVWVTEMSQKYSWDFSFQDINILYIAIFAYSVFSMVQASEIFRGALNSIDKGQFDAAKSIGQTDSQMLRRIILPQLLPVSIPMIGNLSISLMKATSLVSLITVVDILMGALITANTNYRFFESYLAASIIYWVLSIIIEQVTKILEKRYSNVAEGNRI